MLVKACITGLQVAALVRAHLPVDEVKKRARTIISNMSWDTEFMFIQQLAVRTDTNVTY